jgi:hypothetical protein
MEPNTVFIEQQGFSQGWLRYLLPALILIAIVLSIVQYFTKEESLGEAVIAIVLLSILSLFIFSIRMETKIKTDGIYVRFSPFHIKAKFYSWEVIHQAFIREYNPLREYGGWGIRMGLFGHGWAYNVSGTTGIQLIMKDGMKLLIGTRQPHKAAEALKRLGKLHHIEL